MSKGSARRTPQITKEEEDLRYELVFRTKGDAIRKAEILQLLKQFPDTNRSGFKPYSI